MIDLPSTIPSEVASVISGITEKLSQRDSVNKIYLYGSYAVGGFTADSDIDIAVFVKHGEPCGVNEFVELNRIANTEGYDVQMQIFSEDELSDPCGIIEEIVSFGVILYQSKDWDSQSNTEGLFISKTNNLLSVSTGDSKLSLLASRGDFEVMHQVVYPSSVVWISPAEDKTTIEFFYVISGSLILKPDDEAIKLGPGDSFYANALADDVIIKVLEVSHLLYVTNKPLFNDVLSFQGDLEMLMHRVDDKDNYTYQHSKNVMNYSVLLFRKMKPNESLNDITTASLFHDVGKCLVPDEILKKPGKLTFEEFQQMMKHPANSARLIQNRFGERVAEIAKCHHERLDGSGYPFGRTEDDIPFESRIIAVADSFDAMTTQRVYRSSVKGYLEAAEELCSMTDQYDPKITAVLKEMVISGELFKTEENSDETI